MDTHERAERRAAHVFTLIFVLLAAGIVTAGYLYYRHYEKRYRVEVERQLSAVAEMKVGELAQWRKERMGDADILFKNVSLSALVRRFFEKPEDADAQRQLRAWIGKYEAHYQYDRVFLLDAQGVVRMSTPEAPEPDVPHLAQDAAEVLRSGKVAFQDFHRDAPDRPIYLAVMIPILDEQDGSRPLGVLVLRIDPETYLYPFIQRWPTPSRTAETLLIRRDGNDALFLNELRFQKNTALTLRTSLESKNMPAVRAALGQEGIVEGVDYRGVPVISDVRAVPDSPWFLVARMDTSEVYAPVKQMLWLMVVLVGALLLGAGTGLGLVWRHQSARFYQERYEAAEVLRETKEYLENLINHANAPIVVWDPQFRITRFNRAFESLTGRKAGDVLGLSLEILFPPALLESSMKLIRETLGGERWETVEISILHLDGSVRTVLWNSANVLAPDGKTSATIAQGQDITERKRAEEAVRESLNRWQTTFDGIRDSILLLDNEAVIFQINNSAAKLFGKSQKEMQGHHCWEIVHGTSEPIAGCPIVRMKQSKQRETMLLPMDDKWYEVAVDPLLNHDGSLRGAVQIIADITERKQAEEALCHQNELLQNILDNIPVMVAFLDREGRHHWVNRCWQTTLGCSLEEAQQKDVLAEFYPDPAYRKYVVDHIAAAAGTWGDFKTRTRDGRVLDTFWINVLLSDGSNIGIGIDITERKRAEEELRKLERQIQQTQKLESLGVLAGGIAHDFNNILMVVLGYAELALKEISPVSAARESIGEITTAVRRAAELCRQMLAYAGRASFAIERVDLRELIEEMAHLLKTSISKKAILNLHLERGLPPIQADPSQIRQIVMNLIVNASEAIGDKSGVITISTGATRCDEAYLRKTELRDDLAPGLYVHLEVADTGCGMDAETRARIFEPFFSTKFTGRGLGLAAVMGIVRAHKGALKVYSEPGKGTTFKILFPALETGEDVARAGEDSALAEWQGKGTILLADDEESVRAVGARMLERLGFTVLTAANGREAVDLYRERGGEIALVLLDLTMPHMDGAEAFGELRRINPEVRVILASGYSEEDVASRFAGKGLAGVLQKPYSFGKLKELLVGLMPPASPSK